MADSVPRGAGSYSVDGDWIPAGMTYSVDGDLVPDRGTGEPSPGSALDHSLSLSECFAESSAGNDSEVVLNLSLSELQELLAGHTSEEILAMLDPLEEDAGITNTDGVVRSPFVHHPEGGGVSQDGPMEGTTLYSGLVSDVAARIRRDMILGTTPIVNEIAVDGQSEPIVDRGISPDILARIQETVRNVSGSYISGPDMSGGLSGPGDGVNGPTLWEQLTGSPITEIVDVSTEGSGSPDPDVTDAVRLSTVGTGGPSLRERVASIRGTVRGPLTPVGIEQERTPGIYQAMYRAMACPGELTFDDLGELLEVFVQTPWRATRATARNHGQVFRVFEGIELRRVSGGGVQSRVDVYGILPGGQVFGGPFMVILDVSDEGFMGMSRFISYICVGVGAGFAEVEQPQASRGRVEHLELE